MPDSDIIPLFLFELCSHLTLLLFLTLLILLCFFSLIVAQLIDARPLSEYYVYKTVLARDDSLVSRSMGPEELLAAGLSPSLVRATKPGNLLTGAAEEEDERGGGGGGNVFDTIQNHMLSYRILRQVHILLQPASLISI